MNKKIAVCEKDIYYLQKLHSEGIANSHNQPHTYKSLVVMKPWGYEFLAFENEFVAIWFLHIKEAHSTSMHCHPNKKTTLAVLNGECFCHTFMTRNNLFSMDAIEIEKGVFHSTTAHSIEGIYLLELETPPNKTDLVRFNDQYGRAKIGYEQSSQMVDTDLDKFNFFHFDETSPNNFFHNKIFETRLCLFENAADFADHFQLKSGEKALICRGQVNWGNKYTKTVSELFEMTTYQNEKIWINEPLTLFCFRKTNED